MTASQRIVFRVTAVAVLLLTATWIVAGPQVAPRVASANEPDGVCPLASPPDAPPPMVNGHTPRLSRICFVPLGELKTLDLAALAAHYEQRFGITVGLLPAITPGPDEYEPRRRQFVAEELIVFMRHSYRALDADKSALLIGFTESDIYLRGMPSWDWGFSLRVAGRFAVVSSARMDPTLYRQEPSPELLNTRARKMTTKQIGMLFFGLPLSQNPQSALYDSILGLDALDAVGEDF